MNAVTLEPEAIQNLHGTDLLWESLKSYILLFLNGVSLADIELEGCGEFDKSETNLVAAMEPHTQSMSMH